MSLWMAILLTVLSANANAVSASDIVNTNTSTENSIDVVSFGKTAPYFVNSAQQQIIVDTERESLPLSLDDNLWFFAPNKYNSRNILNVLENNKKSTPESASFSKYFTKQLLFPFHSHW